MAAVPDAQSWVQRYNGATSTEDVAYCVTVGDVAYCVTVGDVAYCVTVGPGRWQDVRHRMEHLRN